MYHKVKATIAKYRMINKGDRILVGVSGGPDSIALAHVLADLASEEGFSLHIAHLNHMFRGYEADRDADSVKKFAANLGVPYTIEKVDVPAYIKEHCLSAQTGAREVRYSFFEQLMKREDFNKVATGHHADDQAETVVMNILRGSGLAGIAGIPPVRGGVFIRPLIEVTREEISNYCKRHNLPVVNDSSNEKDIYLRNKIRHKLLPILKKEYNPNVAETFVRLSDIVRVENEYLNYAAKETWSQITETQDKETKPSGEIVFNLDDFLVLHVAIQRRLLMMAWEKVRASDRDLAYVHVEQLLDFLRKGPAAGWLELPKGIKVRKAYGRVRFFTEDVRNVGDYELALKVPGETYLSEQGITVITKIVSAQKGEPARVPGDYGEDLDVSCENFGVINVDFNLLPGALKVRNRRPGDRFRPLGMKGTKKLKDFFIDVKIPVEKRERYPIIVSSDEIVSIGTLRLDDRWKVSKDTRDVLQIKIIHKMES